MTFVRLKPSDWPKYKNKILQNILDKVEITRFQQVYIVYEQQKSTQNILF